MKLLAIGFILISSFLFPIMGNALTLEWNRNSEADMKSYHVYVCRVENCTASDQGLMWIATVPQTPLGVKPSTKLPDNVIGAVAVTAQDTSNLTSLPSVSLPFSSVSVPIDLAPLSPSGLILKP